MSVYILEGRSVAPSMNGDSLTALLFRLDIRDPISPEKNNLDIQNRKLITIQPD